MNKLTELADLYLTDKGTKFDGCHNFTSVYNQILEPISNKAMNILEIGIFEGASAKMWRDYFPNSIIYCCDIHTSYVKSLENEDRIVPFIMDQGSRNELTSKPKSLNMEFDIIIDDGSHQMNHQQLSFGILFKYLKSGGYYIIEDLHTSLNLNYTSKFDGYDNSTLNMFRIYEETLKWESSFINESELNYLNETTNNVNVYGWDNQLNKEKMSITSIIHKK